MNSPSLKKIMQTIAELIAHPDNLNKDTLHGLREIVAKYPYYQAARILFLQNLFLLHDPLFGEELRRAAIYLPDRTVLFKMVEGENYEVKPAARRQSADHSFEPGRDRTQTLIDDFLGNGFETERPNGQRRPLTVADATTDYAAYLLQMDDIETPQDTEETSLADRSGTLIDEFIENKPDRIVLPDVPDEPHEDSHAEENDDSGEEGYLTLTLAKIYIKQQRYEKALEIIRKVNLNNPKKSGYFADQIRFLQKLIVNKNHQKQ